MSRPTRPLFAALLAAAALSPWTGAVRAETHEASAVTLGSQTEAADAIVVATLVSVPGDACQAGDLAAPPEFEFRVDRSIQGDLAVGGSVRVRWSDPSCGTGRRIGGPHLLFLRRVAAARGLAAGHAPVAGVLSLRAFEPGSAEARFPALVATLRETLDAKDEGALRTILVLWMEDADPGVAWSAATDFVRHEELHAAVPESEAARIVAAFRRQPAGKNTKDALALAVAATRSPDAANALVESLALPGAARIRGAVAEALRRLDAPETEGLLVARLAAAKPGEKPALLGALGVAGAAAAVPVVRPLLDCDDAAVRTEAAAALGGMARNARERDPSTRLGVADALAARLSVSGRDGVSENECRAVLWALAQLDEPKAFDALRSAAEKDPRREIRDWAARLVARPRQSLLFRP